MNAAGANRPIEVPLLLTGGSAARWASPVPWWGWSGRLASSAGMAIGGLVQASFARVGPISKPR
jgi:hypothetical protein